jgi:hypothetical protein
VLTVATDIDDVSNARYYCDSIAFMLKRMLISHPNFILDVLHMHKKLRR